MHTGRMIMQCLFVHCVAQVLAVRCVLFRSSFRLLLIRIVHLLISVFRSRLNAKLWCILDASDKSRLGLSISGPSKINQKQYYWRWSWMHFKLSQQHQYRVNSAGDLNTVHKQMLANRSQTVHKQPFTNKVLAQDKGGPSKDGFLNNRLCSYTDLYV